MPVESVQRHVRVAWQLNSESAAVSDVSLQKHVFWSGHEKQGKVLHEVTKLEEASKAS